MSARVEARTFPPVEVSPPRPEKASQSLLAKLDVCPRSAYFYLRYGGGSGSAAMAKGSAFHAFAERATKLMLQSGETSMPPDVGRDLMSVVLSEHRELIVPAAHHDSLREMAWNWCEGTFLEPESVVAVEQMWEARCGDWMLRGKVDLAYMEPGPLLRIVDYKTSFYLPSQATVEGEFQGHFYGWLMANGAPEGEERTMPLLNRVYFDQSYPHYTDSETGELVSRGFEMDANALSDFEGSLRLLCERLEHGLETNEWPAQPGSHCSRCPSPKECPIPAHLNADLPITDEHGAETVAALILDHEKRKKELDTALKAYVTDEGEIQVGDLIFGFKQQESQTLDKDALAAASASGEPFDLEDIYKTRHSTRFGKRKA